jgi:hypothetical protein
MAEALDLTGAVDDYLALDTPPKQLQRSMAVAVSTQPEMEAEYRQAAQKAGIPVDSVRAFPAEAKQRAALSGVDYDAFAKDFPGTTRFLSDAENAKIAHDDLGNLSAFERAVGVARPARGPLASFSNVASGLWQSLPVGTELARQGIRLQFADLIGSESMRRDAQQKYDRARMEQVTGDPHFESATAKGVYGGVSSTLRNIPGLIGSAMTRSVAPMLATMGLQTEAEAYGKYRGRGASPGLALAGAAGEGATEVVTELIPMSFLVSRFGKVGAGQFISGLLAREVPTEQLATLVQDAIDTAVANPDKTWGEYAKERPDAAYQTLVATVTQSALMGGFHAAASHGYGRTQQATQAEKDAATLAEILKIAAESKLRQRDPQTFTQFVATATQDGPLPAVYVNAATFQQSAQEAGVDIAKAMPETAAALQDALATNSDVRIPVSELATVLPGTTMEQGLIPHMRTAPDAPTQQEAGDKQWAEDTKAATEKLMAEQEAADTWRESTATVQKELQAQLDQIKRFTSDVNADYANLEAAFYATQAHRIGITPAEMYVKYPLHLSASGLAGVGVMDQAARVDTPAFKAWFGDSKVVDSAGKPLVVYHGTDKRFTRFNPRKATMGGIHWFTSDKSAIEKGEVGAQGKGNIMELYVSMQKPAGWAEYDKYGLGELKALGYDGAILPDKDGSFTGFFFEPTQVKSATRNKGTYDPKNPNILEQTARGQIQFGGNIQQQASVITLLKGADLSTFLHELGHFHLEVLTDMANQPDAPAEIVADLNHLLKWFGVAPDVWNTLTLDEKRPYHEQFARGFEAYLFEGKSPSVELQSLFGRFRAWLLNVYRQITALNVELTPEVRGVMDRMLATNDDIVAAESARAMMPLYETKPDGMSEADWQEYQALGDDATQAAVDQLQTRSLRDMQWMQNARARVLRDLQRKAADARREMRIEARREVLTEPIYQVWQYLTGNVEQSDKPKKAAPTDIVDPAVDNLFTAIGKLGGIDRAEAIRRWGVDLADAKQLKGDGKHKLVLRAKGGKDIDTMLEALGELGYVDLDEHGKADEKQLEEKFSEERIGNTQYSRAADYNTIHGERLGPASEAETVDLENEPSGKLDTETLKGRYGSEPDASWRKLTNLGMTSATQGLSPDTVAELFGFSSGDELVQKLITAEPPRLAIDGLTDQRMLERFGDLADPAAMAKAANEAVHNEARGRFVATELRMLEKASSVTQDTGRKNVRGQAIRTSILPKAARDYAAVLIARKKIRDVRAAPFEAAEARAAKAAETALVKNDIAMAAAQKRNQLINFYAAKAANDTNTEVEKAVKYLKRVAESETVDADYREQIRALLERYDLRQLTNKEAEKRASLSDWIEAQRDAGFEPVIDPAMLADVSRKPYREMTVEEFRGLVDSVRNIEHLGRLKHKLLTLKDQREFAAVVRELVDSIEGNAVRVVPEKLERNTWADKMKDGATEFFVMHRKFSWVAREMDGHQDAGKFWDILVKPMNAAGDAEAVMREQATIKLSALFEPILKAGKLREKTFIPEINASLSREGRIMVALNAGNAGNLQRLMDGDRWTREQVQAVIDTLTKSEMDFVQGTWDLIGEYRAEIGAQQKRLTGVEPAWVDPTPLVTKHGEYAGGYIPAKYDATRSTRSLADEAAQGIMDLWRGARGVPKARDSFTKGRADKVVDRPLRKDFGVITQHITEVTHRLAWQDYLTDATRLLRANAVDNAIRTHYGPEVLKMLRDTITDIAAGEVGAQNAFESGLNHLRVGATIAGLGWRVTTSLLQPLGLTQSMVRIGPKWVAKGMAEWLGGVAKMDGTAKKIYAKSAMMRLRGKTMQREISEIRNQVSGKSSAIEGSYFYLIQKMQLVADIPTWLGQYTKAIEGNASESDAIAQADQAVLDAQGGGQLKDLSAIQRGSPLQKLFTNFYSFFNTTYNLTRDAVGRTNFKSPASVGLLAVDFLLLYSLPAALATLMKAALHAGDDGEDKLVKQLIADQLTYLFGTVVGLRELAGGVQTAMGLPGDYSGPASVRFFAEVAKLTKQVGQGEADEAFFKALDSVGGILFHYPAGQINATVDGVVSISQGKTNNPGALLVGSNKK